MDDLEDLERTLRDRLEAIGPAPRAVLLQVLKLPDHERARRIGEVYADFRTETFAKLLIDLEESPHARAVVPVQAPAPGGSTGGTQDRFSSGRPGRRTFDCKVA